MADTKGPINGISVSNSLKGVLPAKWVAKAKTMKRIPDDLNLPASFPAIRNKAIPTAIKPV